MISLYARALLAKVGAQVLVLLAAVSLVQPALAQDHSTVGPLVHPPRILKYDMEEDKVIHIESSTQPLHGIRPGGDAAYTSSYLTEFRYKGSPRRGGFYTSLKNYFVQRKLDPRNYQYRPIAR